jgi:hypothetical protein
MQVSLNSQTITRVDQKEISIALIRLSPDEKNDKTGNSRHSLPIDKR